MTFEIALHIIWPSSIGIINRFAERRESWNGGIHNALGRKEVKTFARLVRSLNDV